MSIEIILTHVCINIEVIKTNIFSLTVAEKQNSRSIKKQKEGI